jgi:hypothetical protein
MNLNIIWICLNFDFESNFTATRYYGCLPPLSVLSDHCCLCCSHAAAARPLRGPVPAPFPSSTRHPKPTPSPQRLSLPCPFQKGPIARHRPILKLYSMFYFDCTLSLYELYDAIVALRPTFLITLVTLSLGGSSLAHAMVRWYTTVEVEWRSPTREIYGLSPPYSSW